MPGSRGGEVAYQIAVRTLEDQVAGIHRSGEAARAWLGTTGAIMVPYSVIAAVVIDRSGRAMGIVALALTIPVLFCAVMAVWYVWRCFSGGWYLPGPTAESARSAVTAEESADAVYLWASKQYEHAISGNRTVLLRRVADSNLAGRWTMALGAIAVTVALTFGVLTVLTQDPSSPDGTEEPQAVPSSTESVEG
jgi:hypothetical protein